MIIKIKNMVSLRCIMAVEAELKKMNIEYGKISLGEIEVIGDITSSLHGELRRNLALCGLEVMEDRKILLIEKTQNVINEMFNLCYDRYEKLNYPKYITERLNARYAYLSSLFSEVKGITLQQFIIEYKINKVKELLQKGIKPTDISYQLGYSSIAHLSNQFKKTTGNTLTSFRSSIVSA